MTPSGRRHQELCGTVDVLVHPHCADRATEVLVAYVEDSETGRRQLFESAGYRAIGRLDEGMRIGNQAFSLTICQKRGTRRP